MLATLNQRSNTHNSCEDSLMTIMDEDGDIIAGCIADGCSTGINSHFTSQLLCYLAIRYTKNAPIMMTGDQNVLHMFQRLETAKAQLGLTHMHLLSTCILFSYDIKTRELLIRIFGDGVYYINDVEYIVDQDNKPDYIGYHIGGSVNEIRDYLSKYPTIRYTDVNRFVICSDGIKAIERGGFLDKPLHDPVKLLFHPPTSNNYLKRMWNILKRDGYTLSDDLSIISYGS